MIFDLPAADRGLLVGGLSGDPAGDHFENIYR
jgi:hypothetical protein